MDINFPKLEKKILKFWKENKIFERSIKQRARARNFVFYEGPPTANAEPGIHSVLARVYKDIILRYKTMQGFKVLRKAGWDTHGLPVELEIEKKLGLKNKKDIEKYGIARFNKKCKESVWAYKTDWEKLTERIGFWLDMENPYITYEPEYIETVWWIIKEIYKKGLLYQDYKVVPYCWRCGTSLSSHEVALGYQRIEESAIYVKLKVKNEKLKVKDTYLLIWTTTPWTLPGNVAVAVNPEFTYAKIKVDNKYLILAKERTETCGIKGKITQEFKGKDLLGLEYEPLFPAKSLTKKAYYVIAGDFVSLEEGTGLVHIAPAFGEEDMEVGKENNLPIILNVDEEGKFKKGVKNWAGKYVKDADPLIILDLKKRNLLFKEEKYFHDYPFCWRCSSPLLYYAKQSWFINMQKVKKNLIRNNQKINWIPSHLKEGRFGEWLREIKDWAFSRERYWGIPLPIWQCKKCGNLEVVGSNRDLLSQKFSNNNYSILRHGESLRQTKKVAMCWPEKTYCPLTKKGEKEVKIVAKKIKNKKIDIIFTSDLLRTKQTAQIVSEETGAKIIFDKRLREYNVGIFNGTNPKLVWEYLNKKKNIILAKPPKGESLMEIGKRMYNFLKEVSKEYQNKNILIVSHELPLTIFEGTLKGWPIEKILKWRKWEKGSKIKTSEWRKIEFKNLPYNEKMELDFHRPYVDEVKFYCPKCENLMERVPEVIDCWFDSGSMPFAQYHYPFENKKLIDQKIQFPANYISEAVDQTRGWFYTLLAISTLLGFGIPYKNVISLGHVLDEKGEKMSKSKGNVVKPWPIVEKYGTDATRWYFFTVNQPGDAKLFKEKDIEECLKRFLITSWNCYTFFETYNSKIPNSRGWRDGGVQTPNSKHILDRWIISRLNELTQQVTENLDKHNITFAARAIENFVIEDLSQWYIRRSRKRFHPIAGQGSLRGKKTGEDFRNASEALAFVLLTLSKLTAPFIPFFSEHIYQRLIKSRSVHLENWPKVNKKLINKKLNWEMEKTREVVRLALAERARSRIKVRQPLQKLKIKSEKLKIDKELLNLIKDEVNIKEVVFDSKIKKPIELDTRITPALKEEGMIRGVIRQIQEMRKRAGYKPRHRILVRYSGTPNLNKILVRNKSLILEETKAKDFQLGERPKRVFGIEKETKVDGQKLWLAIRKL